jgi:PilZ domain
MSDSNERPESQPERRRAPRTALRLGASIRESGRSRVSAKLIDISTHGCRIEATSGASADTWVMLSIAGLETQYCRIVWRCHEFAGIEFAAPLAETVLDRLLQDQNQLCETAITELRDIAIRTHRLSTQEDGDRRTLAELSRKCAVDAVVGGLRLGETKQAEAGAKTGSRPR